MLDIDESQKEVIRPDFNRVIMIDFLASRRGSFGEFSSGQRSQKPIFDCVGQGCRIICTIASEAGAWCR